MHRKITIAAPIVFASAILCGQSVPVRPEFEIASIRPLNAVNLQRDVQVLPGGIFKATNYTLEDLIKIGWDVRSLQISGGPGWLRSDLYDVEARPPSPLDVWGPGSDGERRLRLMVQSLLADRFKLALHSETKQMGVYFLVVGKNGASIRRTGETGGPGTSMHGGNGQLTATQIDMRMLARFLGGEMEVPVIDKTELTGVYDVRLEWNPEENAPASSPELHPSIFTAVRQQLGLRLESGKGPVEILAIDHAEKASAN